MAGLGCVGMDGLARRNGFNLLCWDGLGRDEEWMRSGFDLLGCAGMGWVKRNGFNLLGWDLGWAWQIGMD